MELIPLANRAKQQQGRRGSRGGRLCWKLNWGLLIPPLISGAEQLFNKCIRTWLRIASVLLFFQSCTQLFSWQGGAALWQLVHVSSAVSKSKSHICVPAATFETVKLVCVYVHSCMLCLRVPFTGDHCWVLTSPSYSVPVSRLGFPLVV